MPEKRPDRTRNIRQARRREREKQWLIEHGWTSWEPVHTALIKGKLLLKNARDDHLNAMEDQYLDKSDQ